MMKSILIGFMKLFMKGLKQTKIPVKGKNMDKYNNKYSKFMFNKCTNQLFTIN